VSELPPDSFHPETLEAWATWLAEHHHRSTGVWLVSWKAAGRPRVDYEEAVCEALCWGWIDSVYRRLDEERSLLRFTPRKKGSVWARSNKDRIVQLEAAGRMQPAGRALIEAAKADGTWTLLDDAEAGIVPDDLTTALGALPDATEHFRAFPPGEQRRILSWLALAKTPSTRKKRIEVTARSSQANLRFDHWNSKETNP
jgi:uncharacterized protein YdeI (YjbR/CyaY-like superfamily)